MLVAAWVARVRLVVLAFAVQLELAVETQQHRCLMGAKRAGMARRPATSTEIMADPAEKKSGDYLAVKKFVSFLEVIRY